MDVRTIGHYEVLEKLGEGGMGAVYKARDLRLDRYVALKTISSDHTADQARRRRFIQEAKAASALNHPNIITIHEIAQLEGADYIAMEFIPGVTLRALVEQATDLATLMPILRQLAEAVAVAHAAGIVHRDIKPDNVMLRPDGYVKILDFGLARLPRANESRADTATGPGVVLGTTRYMSPEQARGEPAESPSDVFSLGIVFYELATANHPFQAATPGATAWAILSQSPTAPSRVNPEIPPLLEDLILRMLAKEPVLRPSASAVQAELLLLGQAGLSAPPARVPPARRVCVGREREYDELQAAFAATVAGSSTLLCVTGEPGLGKTTLVEEFLDGLRSRRGTAWVARGRCSERLGGTDALLPILEGLESLVRGDSGDQAARLMKRFAPTWYLQVAPSMGDKTQEALIEQAKTASHERMKRELHAFLEELARARPLVMFVDDVHWSDVSTCDLLSYIGSRCRDLPLLLIATYRPTEMAASKHLFLQVRLSWQGRGAARDLVLGFLSRDDVGRLVALRFPDHRFPEDLLALVHAKTEGSPLFVTDLLRYLRDAEVLRPQGSAWVLARPLAEIEKEMPATIRSMIQLKIDGFSEDDRRLLRAAAVQGVQFDSAVLAKALVRDAVEVEERLQELDGRHGFVRAAGEQEFPDRTLTVRYRFVHVFYQNALYGSLAPSRRAALSATVANALLSYSADKVPALAADLAFLFEAARDFARAAPFCLSASRHAARLFAYPEAVTLAQKGLRAAETLPDSDERAKLELALSLTLGISLMATKGYATPEVEHAHERSRELCLRLGDRRRLSPVLWGLYVVYLIGGRLAKALEIAEEMQEPAQASSDPGTRIQALHAMGVTLGYMGRMQEAREYLERAVTHLEQAPFQPAVYVLDPSISSQCMLARFQVVMGHLDQAVQNVEEAVERAQRLVHPQSLAYATFFYAWVRHDRGEEEPALELADSAMALAKEHGLPQIREWARVARAWALCAQGRAREGVDELRRSLYAQQQMQSLLERPYCLGLLARGLSQQGLHPDALGYLDEALALIEQTEERFYEAELHRLRGDVLLGRALEDEATAEREGLVSAQPRRDDPLILEAEAAYQKALQVARRSQVRTLELRAAASRFRLRQRLGDAGPARQALSEALAWFTEGTGTPHVMEARRLVNEVDG